MEYGEIMEAAKRQFEREADQIEAERTALETALGRVRRRDRALARKRGHLERMLRRFEELDAAPDGEGSEGADSQGSAA